jgi:hypothetical protein
VDLDSWLRLCYKARVTLAEYLKQSGEGDAAFGARCKPAIHRTTIWQIKKRKRSPRAEHVAAIEVATEKKVHAKDLVRTNGHRPASQ